MGVTKQKETKLAKTVKEAQKDLNNAIDQEMARTHTTIKPYWEQLDKAWAEVRSRASALGGKG